VGAYTATATLVVRQDIREQLGLADPQILVGRFDRPNLLYRVRRRHNLLKQVTEVLDRHQGESGIIYCIRRADVDEMCAELSARGYRVAPYHAGMTAEERKTNQDAFIRDKVDTVVATIAFGMGIDKSNVRYVVHAGMPKSLEHYQQESGRAGRDGLEAECFLLFSGADFLIWKSILQDSEPKAREIALAKLGRMLHYCNGALCRHKEILGYFGQSLDSNNCRACDICLGEIEGIEDALIVAQKILSGVLRQGQRFGADYTAGVLTGSHEERIVSNRHDQLSTYNILAGQAKPAVREWIEQLADQEYLERTGEFSVLKVTEKGLRALKGLEQPLLLSPAKKKTAAKPSIEIDSWDGVDRGLYEELRAVRRKLAGERSLPAYIVFGDAALRDMARKRPSTPEAFLYINGVGEKKLEQYGTIMLNTIRRYCAEYSLDMDVFFTTQRVMAPFQPKEAAGRNSLQRRRRHA
jgi:ATP-dependent DNA helicase RecQ